MGGWQAKSGGDGSAEFFDDLVLLGARQMGKPLAVTRESIGLLLRHLLKLCWIDG